ncbi:MAG TPA: hypothetical protein VHB25_10030 [Gemmatimonadaceae bacterium]|nr:hypothetical protein [Gemmatimonadaceae bacterium]
MRKAARPTLGQPNVRTTYSDELPIGPFINANPRLIVGQRFTMGLNVRVAEPVTIWLTSSDPAIASVPERLDVSPKYNTEMFDIVAHAAGRVMVTAVLGEVAVTTYASVGKDTTDIESLVGTSPNGPAGEFVYELGSTDAAIAINMSGPVVKERIATITSSTPEVASVPASVVIPGDSNWPVDFPLALHAVGTARITVTSNDVTLETMIEVIPPVLWIASIELSRTRVKPGDDVEMTITMTDDVVRDTAITIERHPQLAMPTGLVIPRGKRSGSVHIRVLDDFDGRKPMGIRWLHSLHLVGLYT